MRDQLRAMLITAHILAVCMLTMPAPVGISEAAMQDAEVQGSLATARAVVGAFGWQLSKEEATDLAYGLGTRFMALRSKALTPVRPYAEYLGVKQGWRMFGLINREPARMEAELLEAGAWRTIYVARDPDLDWMADLMDHERVRGFTNQFSWAKRRRRFRQFSKWLARQAATDFPEATKLRTRMVILHIVPPAQLKAHGGLPVGEPFWETPISLAPLREGRP
jgi:hypothetical protein